MSLMLSEALVMAQKIAVALINGFRSQTEHFADNIHRELLARIEPKIGTQIVLRVVDWAEALTQDQTLLLQQLSVSETLYYPHMRNFIVEWVADALAYQPTPHDRRLYDLVHRVFAQTLRGLARAAGEDAPLCIIAHGLGSVITSNYLYDLQHSQRGLIAREVLAEIADTPLERGDTLAQLYTISSPLALWSMRFSNGGKPIEFPHPAFRQHFPHLPTQWINFYDPQDVLAYPIKPLNSAYWDTVTEDRAISTGRAVDHLTPQQQRHYSTAKSVLDPISEYLIHLWYGINQAQAVR